MKKDKKEQALIKIKRESFWSKIIKFFRKSKQGNNISIQTNNTESKIEIYRICNKNRKRRNTANKSAKKIS